MKGVKIFLKVKRTDRLTIDLWNIPGRGIIRLVTHLTVLENISMYHPTHKQCQLSFTFIDKQSNSLQQKISEAIKIHKDKPNFNNKEELVDTMKLIVR